MVEHRWLLASRRAGRIAARSALALPPVLAVVDADRRLRGPYTAVGALLRAIVPVALATMPELVVRHNVEILATTPELRQIVPATRETLTSLAVPAERTRFYSRLRTLRITHGLIEFLVDYLCAGDGGVRTLVVDNLHEADPTDREFVAVLLRRVSPALLTVVVSTGTGSLVDPPGPVAVPLAPALARFCDRIDADDLHSPAYTTGLAQAYVDSDGTCDNPADIEAYQRLSIEERARLHDDRAAALLARGDESLLIGAVPYHREHGSDPAGAGLRALRHAQDWCMDLGYYHAVVDLGLRGLALTDDDTDVNGWWTFTTRMTTALAALGRPNEALALYDEARTRTTEPGVHMQAAYATAMLYTRQFDGDRKDHRRARAWVNQAVGIAGILPDAKQRAFNTAFNRNGLALIEFHEGRPDAALKLLDDCIAELAKALEPGEQVLHRSVLRYNRAQVYAALGRLTEAVDDYSTVIEQDPNYAEYYFDRAAVLRKLGRHAEAHADYDNAIRLSPPFPEAYYNRGDLRVELGDIDGAIEDFNHTLELDPDFVDAYVNRAAISIDRGSLADAERDAVAGLACDADNPHLHVVLGQVWAERGQHAGARAAFDLAISADPDLVTALAGRAALAYQTGDSALAIADLRRAVDLQPDDPALRYNLAYLYQNGGQWAMALLYLDRAAELAPDDPDIHAAYQLCLDHVATA